ncbi:MAG: acetyl-CoA hydrolase/transferase family protein [Bdellovibrionales bacterium]|nr:acetyl-CoA hydrolase/transferase family protein [Bdellovibrionales bacterium]
MFHRLPFVLSLGKAITVPGSLADGFDLGLRGGQKVQSERVDSSQAENPIQDFACDPEAIGFNSEQMKIQSAKEAISKIQSHQRVFIQGAAATPGTLIDELVLQADRLSDVEITHLHTFGPAKYAEPRFQKNFRVSAFFVGQNMRSKFRPGQVDYIPCFLSEIPALLRSGRYPIDVAMIHVSPPDANGFCSLGTSVDITLAALDSAPLIIAQINPKMPRVHGDGFIHRDRIHFAVEVDAELPESKPSQASEEEKSIARLTANLIEDGSTLQMGIGSIPDAVLGALKDRRHLGIHTEMWTNGALELMRLGVVDNSRKKIHPGKTVAGFMMGSKDLYRFVDDNPMTVCLDIAYVNNPVNIARNPKVVAINSAVEIDLTGQVCADSIGHKIISGAGGQMDFIRGASLSPGGKPIIALTSRTRHGTARIVPTLQAGAGVVTTRAHVHHVITEYGAVDLYGKTLEQRAKALIGISHPDDREMLARSWHQLFH